MSTDASQLYEMARALPPEQRRDLARRLLKSAERELESPSGPSHVVCAYDELHDDPSRSMSADEVKAYFDANWAGEQR